MTRIVAVLALVVAVFWAVACCGGGGKATSTPTIEATRTATAEPIATPTVQVRHTGIAEVDAVIDAVLSGDVGRLRSLVQFQPMACSATPQGIGGFYCATGEPDGTVDEVLPTAQCEGFFLRADDANSLRGIVKGSVYAAIRSGPASRYVVVFAFDMLARTVGSTITIENGRLTAVDYGCGQTAEQLVAGVQPQEIVLPPP